jgi:hypothetical protein
MMVVIDVGQLLMCIGAVIGLLALVAWFFID